jgi:cell wall-associated NlpC family hydrolase
MSSLAKGTGTKARLFWIDFGCIRVMRKNLLFAVLPGFILAGCELNDHDNEAAKMQDDSIITISSNKNETRVDTLHTVHAPDSSVTKLYTSKVPADSILQFAETLIGTPYKYGSADPKQGFDCSGFITYVFNHFNITVPRSSIGFTNAGKTISLKDARRGDLILFTGTDSTEKFVGHMGIITANINDSIKFIHSTSGKAYGVTITPLNDYYMGRFVKVVKGPL